LGRLGEHLVLSSLPGEKLSRRTALGRGSFDQAATKRRPFGLKPDGAARGVKDALLHIPGASAGDFRTQSRYQLAEYCMTTAAQAAGQRRRVDSVFGFQAD